MDNEIQKEYFGIYHVFNRGVRKSPIFHDKSDYSRFLLLVLLFQYNLYLERIDRLNKKFKNNLNLDDLQIQIDANNEKLVEVNAFCLMPNHFHILINQVSENGLAKYMQKVLTAYTMYYNKKYNKTGHVFQGKYKNVLVEDDVQLLHTSIYIHKNPLDIEKDIFSYTWSSLEDYIGNNRWGSFLDNKIILGRYEGKAEKYKKDVIESKAKEFDIKL